MNDRLVVSCEHGGNGIPQPYESWFRGEPARRLLQSHRGFDAGALVLAREMADRLAAPLIASTVSRLLIDLNRSPGNRSLYSEALRRAPKALRERIAEQYYQPYRRETERVIGERVEAGCRVVHISCHSFTPELDGRVRNADIGLLYDPGRAGEVEFARSWQTALAALEPGLRIRRNYPYAGRNDGFTTYLRRNFAPEAYLGMELEVNQRQILRGGDTWPALRRLLIQSLRGLIKPGDEDRRP